MWSRSGRGKCVERSIEKLRHIGFGLSATLLMALPALGCTGFAAAAAADSVCASALQKIFVNLDAHGAEWRSAARSPFRWALPNPVRRAGRRAAAATNECRSRLRVRSTQGWQRLHHSQVHAVRLCAAAVRRELRVCCGCHAAFRPADRCLSGAAAEDILNDELHDCETIASGLRRIRE